MVNIAQELEKHLPKELSGLLRIAGEAGSAQGQTLYLVGGVVRDLLLGRPNLDIDLVVEGDAILLARHLAKTSGGQAKTHPRFGTAKFRLGDLSIDLVMARSETYSRPGALPTVEPGSIESDLLRRDFSINAMAVHLNPGHFGELLDYHGGLSDLKQGLIRVLHQRSFIDDATRILRALRYEQRLSFRLEPTTEGLLRRDVTMMDTVSGERLRHELELILKEEHPERILYRADELGVLRGLHPSLSGNGWLAAKFNEASQANEEPNISLYLALLAYRLSEEETEGFIEHLKIPGNTAQTIRDTLSLKGKVLTLAQPNLSPSGSYHLLERLSPQAIQASALASDLPMVRQRLQLYLSTLRYVKPWLDGEALKRMGVPPGRRLGLMLRQLKDARLNQKVKTREDEETLVRQWLTKGG